jgi:predicted membrane channel-forming protein YqfA (hemolysin III family)
MVNKLKNNLVWSNLGYLIVWLFWIQLIGIYAIPMLTLFICSVLAHMYESNKIFERLDKIVARAVMITNGILFAQSYQNIRSIAWTILAFMSLLRFYKKDNRGLNHSIWHILSAIATWMIFYGYYVIH